MDNFSINGILNWSGGKDSALALYRVLQDRAVEVQTLFTSLNGADKRVSMHGVPEVLINRQAGAMGMPLRKIYLSENPSMEEYSTAMGNAWQEFKEEGISHSVFGDIFLEDIREYREAELAKVGIQGHFPLWGRGTSELMQEFLDLGFKTIVVSVNAEKLDKSFCGRVIDQQFLKELPEDVDPCGENGEFHTFVFDGPVFNKPVDFKIGRKFWKTFPSPGDDQSETGFWFCELLP